MAIDVNVVYVALIVSLWIGVTAAYIPATGIIEFAAFAGLLVCLYLLSELNTNWLSVMLIIVGTSGFLVMPFLQKRLAVLALAGLILQGIGGLLLFNRGTYVSPFVVMLTLIIPFAYHSYILLPMLERVNHAPMPDEDDLLIGAYGRVTKEIDPVGTVNVNSELWSATSAKRLQPGDVVVILERNGLQLVVEKVKEKNRTDPERKGA